MCNFDKISGFIIAAQIAFLASLGFVIAAIGLGSNPFTSAGNIPIMITSALLAATAAGLLAVALVELDKCANGPCGASVASLRRTLIALIASVGLYIIAQASLALIAAIPFVGSAAASSLSVWAISVSAAFAAMASGGLSNAIPAFNTCMSQQGRGNSAATTVIVVLSIITVLAAVIVGAAAGVQNNVFRCVGPTCKWAL